MGRHVVWREGRARRAADYEHKVLRGGGTEESEVVWGEARGAEKGPVQQGWRRERGRRTGGRQRGGKCRLANKWRAPSRHTTPSFQILAGAVTRTLAALRPPYIYTVFRGRESFKQGCCEDSRSAAATPGVSGREGSMRQGRSGMGACRWVRVSC
jgi:hypothetical protein